MTGMAAKMAGFSHLFTDLRQTPVGRLTRHPELWALLAILRGDPGGSKASRQALLTRIAHQLPQRDIPRIQRAAIEAMLYLASNWGNNAHDFVFNHIPTESGEGEQPMTTPLIRQWLNEGKAEGLAQGLLQGKAETLLTLMEQRFGDDLTQEARVQVTQASPDDLKEWTLRVLDAPSVDAVFNGKSNGDGKPQRH